MPSTMRKCRLGSPHSGRPSGRGTPGIHLFGPGDPGVNPSRSRAIMGGELQDTTTVTVPDRRLARAGKDQSWTRESPSSRLFLRLSLEPFLALGAAEPGGCGLRLPGVPAARAGYGRHCVPCAGETTRTIILASGYFRSAASESVLWRGRRCRIRIPPFRSWHMNSSLHPIMVLQGRLFRPG